MPINISSKLKNEIVDTNVRLDIENLLISKSAHKCFLCNQPINSVTEDIEADHDVPKSLGGATDIHNLNLVHSSCNKFKKDNDTLRIKQFLPMRQFLIVNPESNYEKISQHLLNIQHRTLSIEWTSNDFIILKDGTQQFGTFPVYQETIKLNNKVVYYIFLKIPLLYIFNDNVQPRSIKSNHVFNLFQDLHFNPLHEPIGARLESPLNPRTTILNSRILMFDGQHKAVATALINSINKEYSNVPVDVKLYLNFDRQDAVHLVNSIQSKIIKLGLTKSEFANKMGEEWKDAFERYEMFCQQNNLDVTEIGFVNEKGGSERKRRLEALISARVQQIINDNNTGRQIPIFDLTKNKSPLLQIKETTFYNKILKQIVYTKPTDFIIDSNDSDRETERNNIRILLSILNDDLFTIPQGCQDTQIYHNFTTQSSLNLILYLCVNFIRFKYKNQNIEQIFFQKDFETRCKTELEAFVKKYRDHPIWKYHANPSTAVNKSNEVVKFFSYIKQNQSLVSIADSLELNATYCMEVTTNYPVL
jgi:hypothetical protein